MGARAYLKRASNPFSPVRAGTGYFLLNFDGTGGDGTLNLVGRNRRNGSAGETGLGQLIKRCSDEQAIPLTRYNLPALLMDHMPFAQEGIDAVSLTSLGRSALSVHTSRDTIENLSAEQVQQAGVIAIRVIEKLADSL
jgi:Zn-dependent M28 family amino/carboxypeptidase